MNILYVNKLKIQILKRIQLIAMDMKIELIIYHASGIFNLTKIMYTLMYYTLYFAFEWNATVCAKENSKLFYISLL